MIFSARIRHGYQQKYQQIGSRPGLFAKQPCANVTRASSPVNYPTFGNGYRSTYSAQAIAA
jgi:hypothetical protein